MRAPIAAVIVAASALSCACRRPADGASPGARPAPPAPRAAAPRVFPEPQVRVPGEYLVTVAAGAGEEAVRELFARYGIAAVRGLGGGVFLLSLSRDPGPEALQALQRESPRIQALQPNFVYRTK